MNNPSIFTEKKSDEKDSKKDESTLDSILKAQSAMLKHERSPPYPSESPAVEMPGPASIKSPELLGLEIFLQLGNYASFLVQDIISMGNRLH